MMDRLNWALVLSFLLIIALLSGCGGSSGGGGGSTPTPTYKVVGIGVVLQSRVSASGNIGTGQSINPAWKEIVLPKNNYRALPAKLFRAADMAANLLTSSVAYIFLNWDQVGGADHYRVYYNGIMVWDSNDSHPEDPAFIPANPQAYLDLDQDKELAGKISAPGNYSFQIKALNGNSVVAELPVVWASLGMILDNYPTAITYTPGTHQLSWTGVANANGYRVSTYQKNWTPGGFDSGSTLLTGGTCNITGLTTPTYYNVVVDANALDNSGTPLEITRGVSGFNY